MWETHNLRLLWIFFLFRGIFFWIGQMCPISGWCQWNPKWGGPSYIITEWKLQYLISNWWLNTSLSPLLVRVLHVHKYRKRFLLRNWLTWLWRLGFTESAGLAGRLKSRQGAGVAVQVQSLSAWEFHAVPGRSVLCCKYLDLQLIGWGWPTLWRTMCFT